MTKSDGVQDGDRAAGLSMITASTATVFAMAHHPVGAHGTGGIGDYVHGAMIVLLAVLFYGFAHFALRRDLRRPVILAGLVAYGISLAVHLGAATINGFVVPALAAHQGGTVSHDIFILSWEANQALARLGVFATGTAFFLWSLDFLGRPPLSNRIVGGIGVLAAILPAAALAATWLEMDVHGAFLIYSAHAVWTALVGIQLLRGQI